MTWWSFDEWAGVLELDAPALELHWRLVDGRTVAWWCDDYGRQIAMVKVGLC